MIELRKVVAQVGDVLQNVRRNEQVDGAELGEMAGWLKERAAGEEAEAHVATAVDSLCPPMAAGVRREPMGRLS